MKNFIIAFVCVFITGCVTHIPLDEQSPVVEYKNEKCITVSVIDNRDRVKDGKPPTFIGTAHGAFGIPMGWHVKPILSVEDGDKERDLAQWLQYRVVNGLGNKGWDVISLELETVPDLNKVNGVLQENTCKSMLVLQINEWYFSINLNWVSAFNFDTNTDAIVYEANRGEILFKNFSGRDVIDEVSTDSHQNMIMRAYRDQLIEILSSPEVKNVLKANTVSLLPEEIRSGEFLIKGKSTMDSIRVNIGEPADVESPGRGYSYWGYYYDTEPKKLVLKFDDKGVLNDYTEKDI